MSEEKKEVSRRGFMKTAGAGIVGLAVGAGIGYGAAMSMAPTAPAAATVTTTVTATPPGLVPKKRPAGETVLERALIAAKNFVKENNVPPGSPFNVLCPSGLVAAIKAASEKFAEATGVKFEFIGVPHEEVFTKAMLEATQKAGAYAALAARPRMIGEFVGAGLVHDLAEYVWYYDPRMYGEPDGYPYPHCYSTTQNVGKGIYCLPIDADWGNHAFRKDLLDDPKEMDAFEKQYGYRMKPWMGKTPVPQTFKEYFDFTEFFHRPPKMYGNGEARSLGNGYMPFFLYFHSKREPVMYPFDDDMNPQIATKEGIEAIEEYLAMKKFHHKDQSVWGYTEQVNNYVKNGLYAGGFWPPSMSHFAFADPASVVKGKNITAPPVGRPRPDGTIFRRGAIMGGWGMFVCTTYKWPELGYLYCQAVASPEGLIIGSTVPGSWMDAQRYNQIGDRRRIDKTFRDYYADEESNIYEVSRVAAEVCPPILSINGENEYLLTLDKELHRAYTGEIDAEKAAKNTEAKWNEITDKIGRARQKSDWKWLKALYMFPY
ncbi:MAG: extracellular solute-binding protein [Candidatus Bathyarchaeia archaeon]